jgi:hypothetical protein
LTCSAPVTLQADFESASEQYSPCYFAKRYEENAESGISVLLCCCITF